MVIIDQSLPLGLQANIAAVLSLSLGKKHPEIIGHSVENIDGLKMEGITQIPLSILQATTSEIKRIYFENCFNDLYMIIFNDSAITKKYYPDYLKKISLQHSEDMVIHGLIIYGERKIVNKICSNLQLLR